MNLKELLVKYDLLKYVEDKCDSLSRYKFNSYEKIDNGFILHTDKTSYKVTIIQTKPFIFNGEVLTPAEWIYDVEEVQWYGGYKRIPCMTRSEAAKYPKLPAWLGTALAAEANEKCPITKTECVI